MHISLLRVKIMFTAPIIQEKFFDRVSILELLDKKLKSFKEGYRQNIAITGHRFLGKTSLLLHFLLNLTDDKIIPVYVEIRHESPRNIADRFSGVLLYNFFKKLNQRVDSDLNSLVNMGEKVIPKTVETIRNIKSLIERGEIEAGYSLLFDLTYIFEQETGKLCLVVLDEFHLLDQGLGLSSPFSDLGKKIMVQKDTMYILASSMVEKTRDILSRKLNLLFGNFEIIELKPFDTETGKQFLEENLNEVGLQDYDKRFLILFTGGYPFYLSVISRELKKLHGDSEHKLSGEELIIHTLTSLLFYQGGTLNQYFMGILNQLNEPGIFSGALKILDAISRDEKRLIFIANDVKMPLKEVSNHIKYLMEIELLARNGSLYKFNDRVLKVWVKSSWTLRESSLNFNPQEQAKQFGMEIKRLISDFRLESKKEPRQRVMGLFRQFKNDIVEIDKKNYKLPQFIEAEASGIDNIVLTHQVAGSKKRWLCAVKEKEVRENEVAEFALRCKKNKDKVHKRLLIVLNRIDVNAKLLAKQEKIVTWDINNLNMLLDLYGKEQIIL